MAWNPKQAMSDGQSLSTNINHQRDPHCCGCWKITFNPEYDKSIALGVPGHWYGAIVLVCNECGEVHDLDALDYKFRELEKEIE